MIHRYEEDDEDEKEERWAAMLSHEWLSRDTKRRRPLRPLFLPHNKPLAKMRELREKLTHKDQVWAPPPEQKEEG